MKKYALITSLLFTVLILFFFVAELLHVPYLADDSIRRLAGFHRYWIGALLLAVDVVVPVPSSLVMLALGCAGGVFWGALWSFLGVSGAAGIFWLINFIVDRVQRHPSIGSLNR